MFGFSFGEIFFIALVALILFGNEKLPENMKKLVQSWRQIRKVSSDVQTSWNDIRLDIQQNMAFEDEKKTITQLIDTVEQSEIDAYQTELEKKKARIAFYKNAVLGPVETDNQSLDSGCLV